MNKSQSYRSSGAQLVVVIAIAWKWRGFMSSNWRLFAATLALMLSIAVSFGQAPQKPYRQRLLERAQKGEADAQFELGKNYESGRIGLPQDFSQAQFWYRKAADQADPYAEASLGILFNFGKGGQRDYVQAYMWYERAAAHSEGGNRDSIVELRDALAAKMTAPQIAEARRLAKDQKTIQR